MTKKELKLWGEYKKEIDEWNREKGEWVEKELIKIDNDYKKIHWLRKIFISKLHFYLSKIPRPRFKEESYEDFLDWRIKNNK